MTRTIRHVMSRSLRRLMIRSWVGRFVAVDGSLPASMRCPVEAVELMDQVRETLDRDDGRELRDGVTFLRTPEALGMPSQSDARIHSEPLPAMDYFRWPFDRMARLMARVIRKLSAPLTKRQEQFNLDLLESMKRLEGRLEAQQRLCRQLHRRVAEMESRTV